MGKGFDMKGLSLTRPYLTANRYRILLENLESLIILMGQLCPSGLKLLNHETDWFEVCIELWYLHGHSRLSKMTEV